MQNKIDFDEYTKNYNQLLQEQTGFFSSSEEYFARYKVEIVRSSLLTPIKSILEFGCGIGRNIGYLQQAFPTATLVGSDISAASLDLARQAYPDVEFLQEVTAETLTEKHAPGFDLIFIAGVFHHIAVEQRLAVATSLFKLLSTAGQLIIFEHNPYNPITRKIVNNCPYDADAILLNPTELTNLLSQAGFSVERKAYCLFIPPVLSWLAPLEKMLGWLPLGGQYWVQAKRPL